MNKRARARAKIERDKARKLKKKLAAQPKYEDVFTIRNFVAVLPKCRKGVGWKSSVQKYMVNAIRRIHSDYMELRECKLPRPVSDRDIKIYERGKARTITPIHVKDRVIQKVLCDYALVPILQKTLIYDNGASLLNKGVLFSRNRMKQHLINAVNEYGTDFYVLTFDFKNFFDSIPHSTCEALLRRYILDERIVKISMDIIKAQHKTRIAGIKDVQERERQMRRLDNNEERGICLGSQVSQIIALIIANDLDHYIKDVKRRKYYVRYMDDGIILGKSKEELLDLLDGMRIVCKRIGLVFHKHKTHVLHIKCGFTFLKVKYRIGRNGGIVRKLTRKGTVRMRRKLKKLYMIYKAGHLELVDAYNSMQSWLAHSMVANGYTTSKHMLRLYYRLFDGYRISKQYQRRTQDDIFQNDRWHNYRWDCDAG